MIELPTGTVTFLFTDIEGSTRLLQQLGSGYTELLEQHREIVRAACTAHGGVEVGTEGDAFFVVFPSAPEAVRATVDAQRGLARHPWPGEGRIRVRMGLHTGEGTLHGENYAGIDVHRAARIAAAGHGGQVLLSASTGEVAGGALPDGVRLLDLGQHRLKDLERSEHLSQLVIAGLQADFPPIRSMDARPNNLPVELTTFVGREAELVSAMELLRSNRLVTLTGPGGTGKTRLALHVASRVLHHFEAGVFLVPLASVGDPALVASTIAQALGVQEMGERPMLDLLKQHLAPMELLLVLDNFEQIMPAASVVTELLLAAPRLKVLVTSQAVLHVAGEQEFPVAPLALPDPRHLPELGALSQYDAVALFIQRARSVNPTFSVTNQNAPAVAEICARLDGLPLAIELAAARSKLLAPDALLKRLEHSLTILRGARELPARQQTLHGAIAWSYELLEPEEQTVFRRLGIFVRGWSLEAAEAVVDLSGLSVDVFDTLEALVDKSLVRLEPQSVNETRFSMLQTIRDFALKQLEMAGEQEVVARAHSADFLALAEEAEPNLTGEQRAEWLDRLERDGWPKGWRSLRRKMRRLLWPRPSRDWPGSPTGSVTTRPRALPTTRRWPSPGNGATPRRWAPPCTTWPSASLPGGRRSGPWSSWRKAGLCTSRPGTASGSPTRACSARPSTRCSASGRRAWRWPMRSCRRSGSWATGGGSPTRCTASATRCGKRATCRAPPPHSAMRCGSSTRPATWPGWRWCWGGWRSWPAGTATRRRRQCWPGPGTPWRKRWEGVLPWPFGGSRTRAVSSGPSSTTQSSWRRGTGDGP